MHAVMSEHKRLFKLSWKVYAMYSLKKKNSSLYEYVLTDEVNVFQNAYLARVFSMLSSKIMARPITFYILLT